MVWHCAWWPPSELIIRLWSRSVDFLGFCTNLTHWNWSILGFRAFSWECMGGMDFACWRTSWPYQDWLDFGHGLLIFLLLAQSWLLVKFEVFRHLSAPHRSLYSWWGATEAASVVIAVITGHAELGEYFASCCHANGSLWDDLEAILIYNKASRTHLLDAGAKYLYGWNGDTQLSS